MHLITFQLSHRYPTRKEGIFLPVSLKLGMKDVTIEAAVDTGASFCLFERSVAEALDIDVESGLPQTFMSANGRIDGFGHSVQMNVLGIDTDALVFFFANPGIEKNLLGRRGWLDRIVFGLDEYQQIIYLSSEANSVG